MSRLLEVCDDVASFVLKWALLLALTGVIATCVAQIIMIWANQ